MTGRAQGETRPPGEAGLSAEDEGRRLRARAAALARPPRAEGPAAGIEVLEFLLAHEHYAVETRWVREVAPLRDLTPLPGTPPFVAGIANVRGRVVSVIDLRHFFVLPKGGLTDLNRLVVVFDGGREFGVLADAVRAVRAVPEGALEAASPALTRIGADYVLGLTAEPLVVLDARRLLADERLIVREEAGA